MINPVISVEHLSKTYHLGQIGTGTFTHDLNAWWAKVRGKPSLRLPVGEKDHGNREGEEIWALKDVTFQVEKGEVLGIIGRNGAGKSTLLKILSRVTAPTSGRIKVKGRIASLLEVGTGFHPDLTGRENIHLNGSILGMHRGEINRKFDQIVDFAEVQKFIDTPVKRYSSGMYVRLAFAVAAHLDPEILVVDEVLAVGDAEFQKKCLGKMGEVAQGGRTVLFVSHNIAAISALCSKSILLNEGRLIDWGLTADVIRRYVNTAETPELVDKNAYFSDIYFSDTHENVLISNKGFKVQFKINLFQAITNIVLHFTLRNAENTVVFQERHRIKTMETNNQNYVPVNLEVPPLHVKPGGYSYSLKMIAELNGQDIRVISKTYPLTFALNDAHDLSSPGFLTPLAIWHIGNDE